MQGIPAARGRYDVIGASEGTDLGDLNPDSASFLIRALATHLDRVTATIAANKDAPIEQVEYEVDASNIPAGGLSMKLPTGQAIVSCFLENNSPNTLAIYAGGSASGRSLNSVAGLFYKVFLVPQQITSLAIVSAGAAQGLVRILLTSVVLGPAMGSTVGASTISNPSVPTTQQTSTSGALSNVALVANASQVVLVANPNRIGASFYNAGSQTVFLNYSGTASVSAPNNAIAPYTTQNLPVKYTGIVSAIASQAQQLSVTEFT